MAPETVSIRQVYGFCFDDAGRLLLREENAKFSLLGGRSGRNEYTLAEALHRECIEECRGLIEPPVYFGHQKVIEYFRLRNRHIKNDCQFAEQYSGNKPAATWEQLAAEGCANLGNQHGDCILQA